MHETEPLGALRHALSQDRRLTVKFREKRAALP
jgi:hypothetical protein